MQKIINWFFGKLAKEKLLFKKREDLAIFEILSSYITEMILAGDESRREELADLQRKMEEFRNFVNFIKKI